MRLDDRVRKGLEGLDALGGAPPDSVVHAVIGRGRRSQWGRRLAAGAVALAATIVALVVAPRALDALRSAGEERPAVPSEEQGSITTVAGTGVGGMSGARGEATESPVNAPVDLAFDGTGNLYILELGYDVFGYPARVSKVDPFGRISTVAGPGAPGEAGQLVLGTTFASTGLAVDAEGNVFIVGGDGPDVENEVIRVDPSGNVTAVAGTGEPGFSGDGGPATQARLKNLWDVAVDVEGNLYIAGNSRIRKVDTRGVITTIVGTGAKGFSGDGGPAVEAQTDTILGVTVDGAGNIYFVDNGNHRIRRIDTQGKISTVAGPGSKAGKECFFGEGVPATQAIFCAPEHLAVDGEGNIYVADTYNNRVRIIDTNGMITTFAGSGVDGYSGDGGPATDASLSEPSSVAAGPDGTIYIADSANDRVRKVVL